MPVRVGGPSSGWRAMQTSRVSCPIRSRLPTMCGIAGSTLDPWGLDAGAMAGR